MRGDQPDLIHRMPTHFGPQPGPCQRPGGGRWAAGDAHSSTIWVSYATDARALTSLLPPGFTLDGRPVVTVEVTMLRALPWLAGRGYNLVQVHVPVRYDSEDGEIIGRLEIVTWENLADPIISGREELGWNKVYAEIADVELDGDRTRVGSRASWDGFVFLDVTVEELVDVEPDAAAPPALPLLHWRYLPRSGAWGEPEIEQVTGAIPSGSRVTRAQAGRGNAAFHPATFEQLPTLAHIVNGLARLPVRERVGAGAVEAAGFLDMHDIDVLRTGARVRSMS
jgi:hypothetical protein